MNLKWSITGMTVLGIAAAFCAALLVASMRTTSVRPQSQIGANQIRIVVASKPLEALTVLGTGDLTSTVIDTTDAPEGYFGNPVQVIGKVLSAPVIAGQAITKPIVSAHGPGVRLSTNLPAGMRAVSVEPSGHSGLPGLLYPGCLVDVLGSFQLEPTRHRRGRAVSTTLLQGVRVLAIEDRTVFSDRNKTSLSGDRRRRKNMMVTLMVNSNQAKILQLAMEQGTISLALRNPSDHTIADSDPTLLRGGKLTRLADILEAEARKKQPNNPSFAEEWRKHDAPPVIPTAETNQELDPSTPARWETTIIRGVSFEVRSFPMPEEQRKP